MQLQAALFDLDGTLTAVPSFWQHLHERLGQWEGEAEAHQVKFYEGSIDYAEFCRRDAEHWRGRRLKELLLIAREVPLRPGSRELVGRLKQHGLKVGIVSTGLTLLARRAHRELELDFTIANSLVTRNGVFTGDVQINVEHGRKDQAVELFCNQFGVPPASVLAVGDSDGDLSLFSAVGFSIAFNPTSTAVAQAAHVVCHGESLLDLLPHLPLAPETAGRLS